MESFEIFYDGTRTGSYYVYDDRSSRWTVWDVPDEVLDALKALGLDKDKDRKRPMKVFSDLMKDEYRVAGRKRIVYQNGPLSIARVPRATGERFYVYRRAAEKGDPDYSPLRHDAPHYEGPGTPEGMREWASYYAFDKMDDGTYQAVLDEAWWWGGSHNDGGTMNRPIPEEWQDLPYDEFLEEVVYLASAHHYGFTAEMLKERKGLKEFFGYGE